MSDGFGVRKDTMSNMWVIKA